MGEDTMRCFPSILKYLLVPFILYAFYASEGRPVSGDSDKDKADTYRSGDASINRQTRLTAGNSKTLTCFGRMAYGACSAIASHGTKACVVNAGCLRILDFTDATHPVEMGRIFADDIPYSGETYEGEIVMNETHAYILIYKGLLIIDISNPDDPFVRSRVEIDGDLRGLALSDDFVVIADHANGLWIVDVADPAVPVVVARYKREGDTRGFDGVIISDSTAFVDSYSGLCLIDISDPTNPIEIVCHPVHPSYSSGGVIAVSGEFVCVACIFYSTASDHFWILDVSNRLTPTVVGSLEINIHPEDICILGNTAFIVGNSQEGMAAIDLTDKENPKEVGFYRTLASSHRMTCVQDYIAITDRLYGIHVLDVTDPTQIRKIGGFDTGDYSYGVCVEQGKAYLANGRSGLRIVDVTDPSHPVESGTYDTKGEARGVSVLGNHAYVADYWNGLCIIDVSDPANPRQAGWFDTGGLPGRLCVDEHYAYVACACNGLRIVYVSDPAYPYEVGYNYCKGYVDDVRVHEDYAYVLSDGLQIFNIADRYHPIETAYLKGYECNSITLEGDYAYMPMTHLGIRIVDVSDPYAPWSLGFIDMGHLPYRMAVKDDMAYIADWIEGFFVYDISKPDSAFEVVHLDVSNPIDVFIDEGLIYLVSYYDGIHIYEWQDEDMSVIFDGATFSDGFELLPNYPNPFNGGTTIPYRIVEEAPVRILIHDVIGRSVKVLFDGYQVSGRHQVVWDGRDARGVAMQSGIYFYTLRMGDKVTTKKLTLMK